MMDLINVTNELTWTKFNSAGQLARQLAATEERAPLLADQITTPANNFPTWVAEHLEINSNETSSSDALFQCFIGQAGYNGANARTVVDAITTEIKRCYDEKVLTPSTTITNNLNYMYRAGIEPRKLRSEYTVDAVITTQPTREIRIDSNNLNIITATNANASAALSASTLSLTGTQTNSISFNDAKASVVLAFMRMVYTYDAKPGLHEKDFLAKRIARNLQRPWGFGLPLLTEDQLQTLIAHAISRYYYDVLIVQAGPSDYSTYHKADTDRYFAGGHCIVAGSIMPGVFLTVPYIADFFKCLSLPIQSALPGILLTLGVLINETLCLNTCQCGSSTVFQRLPCCCQAPNHDQDFFQYPIATRAQQSAAKQQWTWLSIACCGLPAQTLAPILRERLLTGLLSTATIASVTSLPVLLGVNIFAGAIAYLLVNALQKRGYVSRGPINSMLHGLQVCYYTIEEHGCLRYSDRQGYANLGESNLTRMRQAGINNSTGSFFQGST